MSDQTVNQTSEGCPEKVSATEKLDRALVTPIRDFILDVRYRVAVFMACLTLILTSAMVWAPAPAVRLPDPDFWGKMNGARCVFVALVLISVSLLSFARNRPVLRLVQILVVIIVDATLIASSTTILCVGLGHVGPQNVFRTHLFLSMIPIFGFSFLSFVSLYFGSRNPR